MVGLQRIADSLMAVQEFTATSVKRGDKLDTAVKAAYKVNSNVSTALTFNQLGKVRLVGTELGCCTFCPLICLDQINGPQ